MLVPGGMPPDHWPIPDVRESLDLKKIPREQRNRFLQLDQGALTLNDVVDTLEKSERYRILTHLGWRQPGLNKDAF